MTTTDDLAIIGAITGIIGTIIASLSIGLQFYKSSKEKPKLSFKIEDTYHFPPDKRQSSIWYEIHISMRIDNLGERDTTISSVTLSFSYKEKPYSINSNISFDNVAKANSTLRPRFNFAIKESEIQLDSEIVNAKLEIDYTHEKKKIIIPKISRLPNYPSS